jgi:hypothetical protein
MTIDAIVELARRVSADEAANPVHHLFATALRAVVTTGGRRTYHDLGGPGLGIGVDPGRILFHPPSARRQLSFGLAWLEEEGSRPADGSGRAGGGAP